MKKLLLVAALSGGYVMLSAGDAAAAQFTVNSTADDDDGSSNLLSSTSSSSSFRILSLDDIDQIRRQAIQRIADSLAIDDDDAEALLMERFASVSLAQLAKEFARRHKTHKRSAVA